jgi:amidophosphoribosyltransferase
VCGVIGIISTSDVVKDIHTALFGILHRGQDASGIMTFDGDRIHLKKGPGMASDLYSQQDILDLKGNIGIGHTRYPTIGATPKEDIQPFCINIPNTIGMCHNGNVANYYKLKRSLHQKFERHMTSSCDVEPIMHLFANELVDHMKQKKLAEEQELIFDASKKTMEKLNGAYSVVGLIGGKGLLAFRDQYGLRPLVFGKREDGYAFCSESSVLEMLGYKEIRDVKPGEVIFVDMGYNVHSKVVMSKSPAHCMFEWVYFSRPDSTINEKSVYEARTDLGRELAKIWIRKNRDVDIVVPVPDTSRTAALSFARAIDKPYSEGLLKNRYIQRTFIMMTQEDRDKAMKLKLSPIISEVSGKKIALVDDSLVRGTVAKRIIKILKEAGAKEVHLLLTCPEIKYPCYYGIDMQSRKELIAAQRTVEEIATEIRADSVTYMTLDGLQRAINKPLCSACLTGEYPTGIDIKTIEELERNRNNDHEMIANKG